MPAAKLPSFGTMNRAALIDVLQIPHEESKQMTKDQLFHLACVTFPERAPKPRTKRKLREWPTPTGEGDENIPQNFAR